MMDLKPFEYLSSLQGAGIHMDLGIIRRVLAKMNHPQDAYPAILVGGTNGKGSICAMTSSILVSAGLKVGLYTSPHLIDVRERIRYNDRVISRTEMAACIRTVKRYAGNALTYFEFLTVVAFLFFLEKKVDVAVLEVGMGGRLDATNVVRPVVSIISNISLEHSAFLGTRLSQIAEEKAGIIKSGGICLTAATQRPVLNVLEDVCRKQDAMLYRIGREIRVHRNRKTGAFSYAGPDRRYDDLPSPLRGEHQIKNAALAVGLVEILSRKGMAIDERAIRGGLANTRWDGRLEVLQDAPQVVVDGAHNPAGVSVLCRALRNDFIYRRLLVICGVLDDKNYRQMIKGMASLADILILTRPASDRARPPAEMTATALQYCDHVLISHDPLEALRTALAMADPEDLLCVTGSLYLVGQIKAAFGASTGP